MEEWQYIPHKRLETEAVDPLPLYLSLINLREGF
jgi:hypothetical protein